MIPENLRDLASASKSEFGELTIEIPPARMVEALRRVKHDLNFEQLTTVTAVDRYPAEPRFEVVYHVHSIANKQRLRLKARISGENPEIESACGVYRSANWYEREVFDLFGIRFPHHPDLRRIMMPDDWNGYPLRKDYPVTGARY